MIDEPSGFSKLSDAVFVADEAITTVSLNDIDFLKHQASVLPVKKSRVLLHGKPEQLLHEMLIVHTRGTYIQPHINQRSAKSFLVISGTMKLVLYDEDGSIRAHYCLSADDAEANVLIRLNRPYFHTLIMLSDTVVFLETTLGPHKETIYADFAPQPNEKGANEYMAWLEKQTDTV